MDKTRTEQTRRAAKAFENAAGLIRSGRFVRVQIAWDGANEIKIEAVLQESIDSTKIDFCLEV